MIRIGVGQSIQMSPQKAAREAARMAMSRAGLERVDLALVFASISYHPYFPLLLKALQSEMNAAHLVGCSCLGVITTDGEWESQHALAVMALSSDTVTASPFIFQPLQGQAERIGRAIGELTLAGRKGGVHSSIGVVFPDTYNFQPKPFFQGILGATDKAVLVGGGASEDGSLMQTLQIYQNQVLSDAITGFVLNGPFNHTIGITQACHPIGNPMMVTRAWNNTIYELAGRSALDCYSALFTNIPPHEIREATGLIYVGFPADVAESQFHRGTYLVRSVVGVDITEGSITVPEMVEEGQVVSFMIREPNKAVRDMESMVSELAKIHRDHPPSFALYFDCCGRGRSLYGKTGVDLSVIKKHFGEIPLIGFLTYSEIAPIYGVHQFHNYSGILVLISE
jgi:small ligand-binding sensory domain FIST